MRDLVEFVAKALASEPDQVRVEERAEGATITLVLSAADVDLGRMIGRQGRTAKALRTLVAAGAKAEGSRILFEIED